MSRISVRHFQREQYEEETKVFMSVMVDELIANEHKGVWSEWKPHREDIINDLKWHVAKLEHALKDCDNSRVRELCGDIGNLAMKAHQTFGT